MDVAPGTPRPFLDESGHVLQGSIAEKIRVEINGIARGYVHQWQEPVQPGAPVASLGPGMPDYFLTE
jgi:hypothetical protein